MPLLNNIVPEISTERNLNKKDAEQLADMVFGLDDPISIYEQLREFYSHNVGAEIRKHL